MWFPGMPFPLTYFFSSQIKEYSMLPNLYRSFGTLKLFENKVIFNYNKILPGDYTSIELFPSGVLVKA